MYKRQELLTSPLNESILKRAQDKGLVEIVVHNLHDYAHARRKTTDAYPFGGDIRKWRQLINLYRLRILINCSMKQTIACLLYTSMEHMLLRAGLRSHSSPEALSAGRFFRIVSRYSHKNRLISQNGC